MNDNLAELIDQTSSQSIIDLLRVGSVNQKPKVNLYFYLRDQGNVSGVQISKTPYAKLAKNVFLT